MGQMQLNFINTLPCDVNVFYYPTVDDKVENATALLNTTNPTFATEFLNVVDDVVMEAIVVDPGNCLLLASDSDGSTGLVHLGNATETHGYSVLITLRNGQLVATRIVEEEQLEKSVNGNPSLG